DEDDEDDDMYMQVDEDEYQRMLDKHGRTDDFVVDDDGAGYADDGADDIVGEVEYAAPKARQGKLKMQKRNKAATPASAKPTPTKYSQQQHEQQHQASTGKDRKIGAMFRSAQMKARSGKGSGSGKSAAQQDDEEFMSSLMNDLEADAPVTPVKSIKRRQSPYTPDATSSYSARRRAVAAKGSSSVSRPPFSLGASAGAPKPPPVGVMDISDPSLDPFGPPPAKKVRQDQATEEYTPAVKIEPVSPEVTIKKEPFGSTG
ncbi:DNA-directed DNA polymerase alpha catalytic subunit pol1, partial [Dipsacomyces acuminosporus]